VVIVALGWNGRVGNVGEGALVALLEFNIPELAGCTHFCKVVPV